MNLTLLILIAITGIIIGSYFSFRKKDPKFYQNAGAFYMNEINKYLIID